MIEVGSYWQRSSTGRVVRIVEVKTSGISVEFSSCSVVLEWKELSKSDYSTTFTMEYDINYFLINFEQLTPLEMELL